MPEGITLMEMHSASNKDDVELITGLFTSTSSFLRQEGHSTRFQSSFPLHPKTSDLSSILPRPKLVARWEIENEKLVCRWIIDDRPHHSSTHF